MTATLSRSTEPSSAALARVAQCGVVTKPWRPDGDVDLDSWADAGPLQPTLYLVEGGDPAPSWWGALDDWIRLPAEPHEIYARADRLLARARERGIFHVCLDEHDILHVGDDLTILTELEARLLRPLIDRRGSVVLRQDLIDATWMGDAPEDPRALDRRVTDLRRAITATPLRIATVRGHGYLLEGPT